MTSKEEARAISRIVVSGLASAFGAAFAATAAARWLGKKRAAMGFAMLAGLSHPMPVILRVFDLAPANGSDTLFYMLIGFNIWSTSLMIAAATLVSAMMADVVEESELATGRRSEGIFFAARSFISKSLSGLGIVFSTLLLQAIDFPTLTEPGELAPKMAWRLGAGYAPLLIGFFVISMICLATYRLTREQHEKHLDELAARRVAETSPAMLAPTRSD